MASFVPLAPYYPLIPLSSYEDLLIEKQSLDDQFLQYRREVKHTSQGSAAKEVRALKAIIRNLEEELMGERRKFQRSASKHNQEYKNLMEEVGRQSLFWLFPFLDSMR